MTVKSHPYLKVVEQPQSRGYRFRYQCEGSSHGGLQGENSKRGKKSFPTVEIVNYEGPARIVVSLVTDEDVPRQHAHELVGKNCQNGFCVVDFKPDSKSMEISFPNLSIMHITKKKVKEILTGRIVESMKLDKLLKTANETFDGSTSKITLTKETEIQARKQAEDQAKNMKLNKVRLCFQAHIQDEDGSWLCLESVTSDPIYDSKAPGCAGLKICRMDKGSGCCTGGDEVFLLCEKVQKDDIKVRFFEEDENGCVLWEDYGNFGPTDVHKQYAIVFKTPKYKNTNIQQPVAVKIQLIRKNDREQSDSKKFIFTPQQNDQEEIGKKRKKSIFGSGNWGGFGGAGGLGGSSSGDDSNKRGFDGDHQDDGSGLGQDNTFSGYIGSPFNDLSKDVQKSDETKIKPKQLVKEKQLERKSDNAHDGNKSSKTNDRQGAHKKTEVPGSSTRGSGSHVVSDLSSDVVEDSAPDCEDEDFLSAVLGSVSISEQTQDAAKSEDTSQLQMTLNNQRSADLRAGEALYRLSEQTADALQNYAMTGNVQQLLIVQRHLVVAPNNDGDLPLHTAIINQQNEAAYNLLKVMRSSPNSQAINEKNILSQTPLHLAVITRQPLMVELLVQHGADTAAQDRQGRTAAHLAAMSGFDVCLRMLLRTPSGTREKPFPELDFRDHDGYGAIHLAVKADHLSCIRHLVDAFADVNLQDGCHGRTALHYAVDLENLAITGYLLLEAGADVNISTYNGNTALHLAVAREHKGMAALLISAGADPEAENNDTMYDSDDSMEGEDYVGMTPIDLADGDRKMIRILNGEPYSLVRQSSHKQEPQTTRPMLAGRNQQPSYDVLHDDLTIIDPSTREKLSTILDRNEQGKNWTALTEILGFGNMVNLFAAQPSPTKTLLDSLEACDGTVEQLRNALIRLRNMDAVHELDEGMRTLRKQSSHITEQGSVAVTQPSELDVEANKLVEETPVKDISESSKGDRGNREEIFESGIGSMELESIRSQFQSMST